MKKPFHCELHSYYRVHDPRVATRQVYFYYSEYGGKDEARIAAELYIVKMPTRLKRGKQRPMSNPTGRSTTGILGVFPTYTRLGHHSGYKVTWTEPLTLTASIERTKRFCFEKHGNNALKLASAYRKKKLREAEKMYKELLESESSN